MVQAHVVVPVVRVQNGTPGSRLTGYSYQMSKRNGDRARFQKDRKRKMRHRERIQVLVAGVRKKSGEAESGPAEPLTAPPAPSSTRPSTARKKPPTVH
jgi:hypothetical protein